MLQLLVKKPTAVLPDMTVPHFEEYEKLRKKLNVAFLKSMNNDILQACRELHIPIYDEGEVRRYMNRITPVRKMWMWYALNERGKNASYDLDGARGDSRRHQGEILRWGEYTKPVPIHILKRAADLQDKVGRELPLYVTDYDVVKPDPFIMTVHEKTKRKVIFGMWDEPGYGDLNTEVS